MAKPKKTVRLRGREETENENLRVPSEPGKPPRPATEPPGAEWSTRSPETATDPGSGEPIKEGEAGAAPPTPTSRRSPLLVRTLSPRAN